MALRHSIPACLLAAACAGLCPAPALAQVATGASLGELSYSLFDLDLGDAHTPSLAFSIPDNIPTPPGSRTGDAQIYALSQWSTRTEDATGRHSTYRGAYAEADVSLGGRGGNGLGQMLTRSVEVREAGQSQASVTTYSWTDALYFTLSPGTRVTFTATMAAWAEIALAGTHLGHAEVLGSLWVRNLYNPNNHYDSDGRVFFADTGPGRQAGFDENVLLSVSLDNTGAGALYAYANMNLQGTSYTMPVSAVPELAPLTMLLAGGVLGLLRTRRRA